MINIKEEVTNKNAIIDTGYDYNKDKHCDLDGWFVDNDGNHRPVFRNADTENKTNIAAPKLGFFNVKDYFVGRANFLGYESNALYTYSLNDNNKELGSPKINDCLRSGKEKDHMMVKRIRELDSIIKGHMLKRELNVFRGIGLGELDENKEYAKELINMRPGKIYSDKAFMSTSHSMAVSVNYALEKKPRTIVFMDIKLGIATHGVALFKKNDTSKEDEYEVLLARDEKLIIEKRLERNFNETRIIYYLMRTL